MTTLTWDDLRCPHCEALIAELISAPYRIRCRRCGAVVQCFVLADTQVITERLKGRWAEEPEASPGSSPPGAGDPRHP